MYQMTEHQLILPDDFFLPFGGKLNKDNRWAKLAALIPWWKVEQVYAKRFEKKIKGRQAVSVRVALGALIIKERLGTSDRPEDHGKPVFVVLYLSARLSGQTAFSSLTHVAFSQKVKQKSNQPDQ